MDTPNERLLRMEEVISITGFSRAKCYTMAAAGDFPTVRAGRSVRIPAGALQRWIERNTIGGETATTKEPR